MIKKIQRYVIVLCTVALTAMLSINLQAVPVLESQLDKAIAFSSNDSGQFPQFAGPRDAFVEFMRRLNRQRIRSMIANLMTNIARRRYLFFPTQFMCNIGLNFLQDFGPSLSSSTAVTGFLTDRHHTSLEENKEE